MACEKYQKYEPTLRSAAPNNIVPVPQESDTTTDILVYRLTLGV